MDDASLIPDVDLFDAKSILFVAPHPDDAAVAAGPVPRTLCGPRGRIPRGAVRPLAGRRQTEGGLPPSSSALSSRERRGRGEDRLTAGFYLGVDAGGTKTEAMVLDERASVVGHARAGPANYHLVGIDEAVKNITGAAREALGGRVPDAAVFGVSGADLPDDYQVIGDGLRRIFEHDFVLRNDADIALRAGTDAPAAAILVLGTGANVAVRTPKGEWFRVRAMSYETGTGGGGLEMTRDILHAGFQAEEGTGPPTGLRQGILDVLEFDDYDEVAMRFRPSPRVREELREAASLLVPLAFRLAADGDEVARGIIISQGRAAGLELGMLIRRAGMGSEAVDVVLAGGLFEGARDSILEDAVRVALHAHAPEATLHHLEVRPVFGAALWATGLEGEMARAFRSAYVDPPR